MRPGLSRGHLGRHHRPSGWVKEPLKTSERLGLVGTISAQCTFSIAPMVHTVIYHFKIWHYNNQRLVIYSIPSMSVTKSSHFDLIKLTKNLKYF